MCGPGACDDGNPCTADSCDVPRSRCIRVPAPATTVCRSAVGACDVAESCDGTSVTCPPNAFAPAGARCGMRFEHDVCDPSGNCVRECKASGGWCTPGMLCARASIACVLPWEAVMCVDFGPQLGDTRCRLATGPCDVEELCDGVGLECPADAFRPAGDPCDDGNPATCEACTGTSGACTPHPCE